jgi:hypothetical protein
MEPEGPSRTVAKVGVETILGALFAWLLAAATSMAALVSLSGAWGILDEVRWPLGAALGACLGLLVLWMRRRKPTIYRYDYPKVTFRYEILLRSCTYRITSDNTLQYSKRIRLRALQNQLDDYVDKVNWSGGDIALPQGDTNVYGISPVTDRVGMWTFYRVHFGRTLAKGEEIEFELTWRPIENWMRSRPFVAMSTDEPTHQLEFHIQIPPRALVKPSGGDKAGARVVFEHLRAVESLIPFKSEESAFDDNGHFARVIKRPMLYRYFKVRWFWNPSLVGEVSERPTIPEQKGDRKNVT